MDPLEKQLLLRDAEQYGYHLVQSQTEEPESVLRKMVSSDDVRLLEGVPVVLTSMLKHTSPDFRRVEQELPSGLQRRFRMLMAVTHLLMFWAPDAESGRDQLAQYLNEREPALVSAMREKFAQKTSFSVGAGVSLDPARLERIYRNYVVDEFRQTEVALSKQVESARTLLLHKAVDQLFTERQKVLLFKMLNNEQMTKTEREYFSRVVKPRLKAMRNPDLQMVATALVG